MKIALLQLGIGMDKEKNVAHACKEVEKAARQGADLVVLPEMFFCPYSNKYFRAYGEEEAGPVQVILSALAKRLGIILVAGSLPEICDDCMYNTSYVYDAQGKQIARHRKMHLFDIQLKDGQQFKESKTMSAGNEVTVFETPFGKMGLCLCFDMRFEELARLMALEGAKCVFVPAAFNMTTGPAHWELMFRQRAVDNQMFTFGISPARDDTAAYVAYGNTLAVNPWGEVLARCDAKEEVLLLDIDLDEVEEIRAQLPILSARRLDVYELVHKKDVP